jgi:uncharacterized protein YeaO (DUF488 family)
MLKTKSILAPKEKQDGIRVSTMSRHTLEDGITPNPEITPDKYDFWLKNLGPSPKLVGGYYRHEISWADYERKYLKRIRRPQMVDKIKSLAKSALERDITILCIEDSPNYCHRRLLAEECKRYEPNLVIDIK